MYIHRINLNLAKCIVMLTLIFPLIHLLHSPHAPLSHLRMQIMWESRCAYISIYTHTHTHIRTHLYLHPHPHPHPPTPTPTQTYSRIHTPTPTPTPTQTNPRIHTCDGLLDIGRPFSALGNLDGELTSALLVCSTCTCSKGTPTSVYVCVKVGV